jgi:hypothetical protein
MKKNTHRYNVERLVICSVLVLSIPVLCFAENDSGPKSFAPVYLSKSGEVREQLCLGGDETEDYFFARPKIDVDNDGNIFVLDRQLRQIMKFDKTGALLRTFSRAGEGPGEIGSLASWMRVTRRGTVMLADYSNARLTEFDNDGNFMRDRKLKPLTSFPHMESGIDGSLYIEAQEFSITDRGGINITLNRYNSDLELEGQVDSLEVTAFKIEGGRAIRIPYHKSFAWTVTPAGNIVIARTDEYKLQVYSPDLKKIQTIQRDVQRLPVTNDDRRRFIEYPGEEEFRKNVTLPVFKPLIVDLLVDHEGNLLVCLYDEKDKKTTYDVFDTNGQYVTTANLPSPDELGVLRNGLVYFVNKSDDLPPMVCWGELVSISH